MIRLGLACLALVVGALVVGTLGVASPVWALGETSPLALDVMSKTDGAPELWLAQRAIEREWVTRDDPAARMTFLPGGKSEMGAFGLSALLPGAGQLYSGEKSGYAYLLAEALSWAGLIYFDNRADQQYSKATTTAGAPSDSASAWSFKRYVAQTGNDPTALEQMYAADPSSFWYAVAHDDELAAGWSNGDSRSSFSDELAQSNDTRRHVGQVTGLLWLNHLISAADAFRAARIYNLPLQRNLELKTKASLHRGKPELVLTLVHRF